MKQELELEDTGVSVLNQMELAMDKLHAKCDAVLQGMVDSKIDDIRQRALNNSNVQ